MAVVIETTIGDFSVDLYTDQRPQTCLNFLKLCKIKYYNWTLFHTVQSGFIAQTGDPTSTGNSGESIFGKIIGEKARYYEAEKVPKIKHDKAGLLSMVNCGDNMLGSQFFITLAPNLQSLDGEHCIFGEITEGLDVILKFNEAICDATHRPYQDIRISHTVILEDPYDDPKGLLIPDRSPSPTKEALMSDRIGADEAIDDTADLTTEEIIEMQKDKEAKARATMLEIIGDIPDADIAPPENILFVCKLNPVTNDDDLEIIFSRFGKIVGCEVIRDRQTGDSLQYAFIEFEDRKSCEEAYFKMDNVLIDDRRIHVDFSQSVAKMRWRGKGKGIDYYDTEDQNKHSNNKKQEKRNEDKHMKYSKYDDRRRDKKENSEAKEKNIPRRRSRDRKERSNSKETRRDRSISRDRNKHHRKRDRSTERRRDKRERSTSYDRKRDRKEKKSSKRDRSKDPREKQDSYYKTKDRHKSRR